MEPVWVESLHNLHCPRCDARLVQRARRCFVPERAAHHYVGEVGTLRCPRGHRLPGRDTLYDYRAERGHPVCAPVAEVVAPHR
jgi:hypothetical protein